MWHWQNTSQYDPNKKSAVFAYTVVKGVSFNLESKSKINYTSMKELILKDRSKLIEINQKFIRDKHNLSIKAIEKNIIIHLFLIKDS